MNKALFLKKTFTILTSILFLLIVLIPSGYAAWTMFHRDLTHTGYSPMASPITNTLLWQYPATSIGQIVSSPAIANGIVYIGSKDNSLYALNATTGASIWNYSTSGTIESSPAVSDGIVYIGSFDDSLHAVNASTGVGIWTFDTYNVSTATNGIWSSPAVSGDIVYVLAKTGILHANNATTGVSVWNFTEGFDTDINCVSSPAISDGVVYVGIDTELYAINAITGVKDWNFSATDNIQSSPAIVDGVAYVGSDDENLYAVNVTDGTELWSVGLYDALTGSPAVAEDIVYIGTTGGTLYALFANNGTEYWSTSTLGSELLSSPAVVNGAVYIGTYTGHMIAYNASNGDELWNISDLGGTSFSTVDSSPAILNGILYFGTLGGNVFAMGAESPEPTPTPTPVPAPTTTIRPTLYFRSDTYETLGVSGYGLDEDFTNSNVNVSSSYGTSQTVYYGFRVYLFDSVAVQDEITSGSPVGIMQLESNVTGSIGATWSCPETSVTLGYQALKVIVYSSINNSTWTARATFVSPVLITDTIEASTWTFILYVDYNNTASSTTSAFFWGDATYKSGISGVTFSTPNESAVQMWRMSNGDLIGFILGGYVDKIGLAFYPFILLAIAGSLHRRYGHFGPIAFFFVIFGGVGGLVWLLVPPWANVVLATFVILGTTLIVWRIIR